MCPFPFFFLWHHSSFPRSPLKKEYKLCPLLKAYSSSVAWWKERNVHMIYVPYDFQYNCGENKRKNDLRFGIVLHVALISRHSFCKWKKCVIFFKILGAFITLFVPPCLLLFHPFCLWSSFRGAEGFIVSFCVCPFPSFSLFVILPYSESRAWPLSLFPHENFQSDYNKAGEQLLMDHITYHIFTA